MRIKSICLDAFEGVMTMEEHAKCVASLLEAQNFSYDENCSHSSSSRSNETKLTTTLTVDATTWKDKVTYRDLLLLQLRQKIEKDKARRINRNTLFSPGAHVYTYSKKVCELSDEVVNYRCSRKKACGNVMRESEYFPGYWLVHYFNLQKYYYCTERVIKFVCDSAPDHYVTKTPDGRSVARPITYSKHDQDLILGQILNAKMYKTPGHDRVTLTQLVDMFKPTYPWLDLNRMNRFLRNFRASQKQICDAILNHKPNMSSPQRKKSSKCSDKGKATCSTTITPCSDEKAASKIQNDSAQDLFSDGDSSDQSIVDMYNSWKQKSIKNQKKPSKKVFDEIINEDEEGEFGIFRSMYRTQKYVYFCALHHEYCGLHVLLLYEYNLTL